jgi:hypothetical protein
MARSGWIIEQGSNLVRVTQGRDRIAAKRTVGRRIADSIGRSGL